MTYRDHLPQLDGDLFVTDGGIETSLIFHDGLDLPLFAAFGLLKDDEGTQALRSYFEPYAKIAAESGTGFILESPTWRASPGWAQQLGYSDEELDGLNRKAIALMEEIREQVRVARRTDRHQRLHRAAGRRLQPGVDAQRRGGRGLPLDADRHLRRHRRGHGHRGHDDLLGRGDRGHARREGGRHARRDPLHGRDRRAPAERRNRSATRSLPWSTATDDGPAYFGINCAHPTHFDDVLAEAGDWRDRIRSLRANASTKSHAELDEATELDAGDPDDLGARYAGLRDVLPNLNVVGGCCGTDHRHVGAIAESMKS